MSSPTFSTITAKLVALIDANALVNEVRDYDSPTFDKSPSVMLVPSGNESDFATTADNRRTYAFTLTIFVPYDPQGAESAEDTLRGVVDGLLNDLDDDVTLTGEVLRMDAAPSAWGFQEREKVYRVATINVRCMANYQIES